MEIDFGKRLRKLRKKHGVSMKELSRKTKLSYYTLTSIETRGPKVPNLLTLITLAKFFDITIDELIKGVKFRESPRSK